MKKQEWPQTQKDNEKAEMLEWIEAIDVASEHTYGSRRMQRALNCLGLSSRPTANAAVNERSQRKGSIQEEV